MLLGTSTMRGSSFVCDGSAKGQMRATKILSIIEVNIEDLQTIFLRKQIHKIRQTDARVMILASGQKALQAFGMRRIGLIW
jgi:hypothetical protein